MTTWRFRVLLSIAASGNCAIKPHASAVSVGPDLLLTTYCSHVCRVDGHRTLSRTAAVIAASGCFGGEQRPV